MKGEKRRWAFLLVCAWVPALIGYADAVFICNGSGQPHDNQYKCRAATINAKFPGAQVEMCSSKGSLGHPTFDDAKATAAAVNGHLMYDGPTVGTQNPS
eukprot:gene21603-120_t